MSIESPPSQPHRRSLLARVLQPVVGIPLAVLIVLTAAPFVYRHSRVADIPEIDEPFDLEAFRAVEVAPEDNACTAYLEAVAVKVRLADGISWNEDDDWPALPEAVRDWVVLNRPALELWMAATAKPDAFDVQPKNQGLPFPLTAELGDFARLASVDAKRLEHDGKPGEAWVLHRASYRCSRHLGMHGPVSDRMVGIAVHERGFKDVTRWCQRDDVTAEMLTTAIDELERDYALTAPLSVSLKHFYLTFCDWLKRPDDIRRLVYGTGFISASSPPSRWEEICNRADWFLRNEPLVSRRLARHVYANLLEHLDKPWADRPPRSGNDVSGFLDTSLFEEVPGVPSRTNRLTAAQIESRLPRTKALIVGLFELDVAIAREQIRHRTLVAGLAAQIYKRRHGSFPPDLESLIVEGILDEIPLDPCATVRQSLKYRTNESEMVIWSVDENGVDDGGRISGPAADDLGIIFASCAIAEIPPNLQ